jgi:hypothetical protein
VIYIYLDQVAARRKERKKNVQVVDPSIPGKPA